MRILHMFGWKLKDIIPNLEEISRQGFNSIQISPIQPLKENSRTWWILYQPLGFSVGNSWIGSKEDLKELCKQANRHSIRIISDVVLNHIADDCNGTLTANKEIDERLYNDDFYKEKKYIFDWNNRFEVTSYSIGLPTLRLENEKLQDIIIDFLNELIDCGISGFRFDAAKNIKLPNEGSSFWTRVLGCLKKKDLFNYAEIIFSSKELIDQYCQYVNVLTDSYGSDKNKLVTFIESHDSYLEFGYTKNMTDEMLINEYRILTQNFRNTLFYTRPFSDLWRSKEIGDINVNER